MDPVHGLGPWTRSMDPVHGPGPYFDGPGPWIRSTEGVHGPRVHVLYFPIRDKNLPTVLANSSNRSQARLHIVFRGLDWTGVDW